MPDPVITCWSARDVPTEWQDQIESWFWREFRWPMARTAPADRRILATADGTLIGHVGLVRRTVTVSGEPVPVGGIAAVMVQPQWRGRGLGRAMMTEAVAVLRTESTVQAGLLICEDHRLSFYGGLGWQEVPGPMTFTNWQGQPETTGHHIMVLPLRGAAWPSGPIDQRGLPW